MKKDKAEIERAARTLRKHLQPGDTVRLKAGFKFYPGCADAQVTLT